MNCKTCKTPQIIPLTEGFEKINDTSFNIIYEDPPSMGNIIYMISEGATTFFLTNENTGLAQGSIDHDASSVINAICADDCLAIGNVVKLADLTISGLEGLAKSGNLLWQENGDSGDVGFIQEDPNLLLAGVKAVDAFSEDAYGIVVGGDFDGVYEEGLQTIVNNFTKGVIVAFLRDGVRVCTQGRCLAIADGSVTSGQGTINVGDDLTATNTGLQKAVFGSPIIAKALQATSVVNSIIAVDVQRINGIGVWAFKKQLTVEPGSVTPESASILTDFPLLVSITDSDLGDNAKGSGFDIFFTKSDGITKIPYERESYDPATGTLVAWVLTDLSDTEDNNFFMFYGNPNSPDQQNPSPVWAARSFNDIFHFNQDAFPWINSAIGKDMSVAIAETPTSIGGQIENASNSNSGIITGRMPVTSSTQVTEFFVSAWIKFDSLIISGGGFYDCYATEAPIDPGDSTIVIGSNDEPNQNEIGLAIFDNGSFDSFTFMDDISDLEYHHIGVRYSSGTFDLFVDGNNIGSKNFVPSTPFGFDAQQIGEGDGSPPFMPGRIDELQVAFNANFSDGFIETSFNNQSSAGQGAGNFVIVGPQEPAN